MQRVGANGRRNIVIFIVIPIVILISLVGIDRFTKVYFEQLYRNVGEVVVIPNFFKFTFTINKGAAFSFLAEKSWGQLIFKIITPFALMAFVLVLVYAIKKRYKFLTIAFVLVISGTLGNYIDRLLFNGVVDFISFQFGSYFFPVFNVADICLTIGVIMAIVHFCFIDKNKLFAFKKKRKTESCVEKEISQSNDKKNEDIDK